MYVIAAILPYKLRLYPSFLKCKTSVEEVSLEKWWLFPVVTGHKSNAHEVLKDVHDASERLM